MTYQMCALIKNYFQPKFECCFIGGLMFFLSLLKYFCLHDLPFEKIAMKTKRLKGGGGG